MPQFARQFDLQVFGQEVHRGLDPFGQAHLHDDRGLAAAGKQGQVCDGAGRLHDTGVPETFRKPVNSAT